MASVPADQKESTKLTGTLIRDIVTCQVARQLNTGSAMAFIPKWMFYKGQCAVRLQAILLHQTTLESGFTIIEPIETT